MAQLCEATSLREERAQRGMLFVVTERSSLLSGLTILTKPCQSSQNDRDQDESDKTGLERRRYLQMSAVVSVPVRRPPGWRLLGDNSPSHYESIGCKRLQESILGLP
jgi:hypothetical protein